MDYCFAQNEGLVVRSSSWSIYEAWPTVVHAPYMPRAARVIPVGAVGGTKTRKNIKKSDEFSAR